MTCPSRAPGGVIALLLLFIVACAPDPDVPATDAAAVTDAGDSARTSDAAGADESAQEIPARRIVSLAPHLTELVFTAGAGERLIGVVEYSDYPAAALDLARVGDAFRIDMEALAALDPDLILAWSGGNPAALLDELRQRGYRVEELATGTLDNIAANLRRIGRLSGHRQTADAAADRYLQALGTLRQRYRDAPPLRVFLQIGRQPLYTVSGTHAIGQIVDLCGGTNVFAALPGLAAAVGVEAVVAADPEVIVATGDADQLEHWRRFRELRAVAAGALFGTDADVLTRDSTRILRGAEQVCAHLDVARAQAGRQEQPQQAQ